MKYYFLKLNPPRADFMFTMTDAERAIMGAHAAWWAGFAEKGWAVAYGPVAGPSGGFGAGFWALPDDIDPASLIAEDPAIKSDTGFSCEINPMPKLVIGRFSQLS